MGVEGPKLPVREKARERWSGVELVPQWWMELDINFVNEYGLLGNCMRVCECVTDRPSLLKRLAE